MKTSKLLHQLQTIIPIIAGSAIYAFGLLYFIIPNELMEGGVTGITVLLNYAFNISPSISTMALNIPLFLVGMKILGKRQSVYTGLGIASLTLFLWLFELVIDRGYVVPFHTEHDYILAALYAGVTLGPGSASFSGSAGRRAVPTSLPESSTANSASAWGKSFYPSIF